VTPGVSPGGDGRGRGPSSEQAAGAVRPGAGVCDPVSDVDRAKEFYQQRLGYREDVHYASFLSFRDPDGNLRTVHEATRRRPGRVSQVVYGSVAEVGQALRDAAEAHGRHEKETGEAGPQRPA